VPAAARLERYGYWFVLLLAGFEALLLVVPRRWYWRIPALCASF
jgi:hypothetical protein